MSGPDHNQDSSDSLDGEMTLIRHKEATKVGSGPGRYKPTERAPTFTILEGPRTGQVIYPVPVDQRAAFIGRDKKLVDWCIDDTSISRRHCKVFVFHGEAGPVLRIQDQNSTNGTFVNGEPITEMDLESGDKIHIADVLVRYDLMDQADLEFQRSLLDRALRGEKDPLTGLLTRRFLEDRLGQLLDDSERMDIPITLIMIDLDHFKQVNDRFGHAAGDVALKRAADAIQSTIRRRDPAVRMGGEEFAAFMAGTPLGEAYQICERLRQKIADITFDDCYPGVQITASLGVAKWRLHEPAAKWIERADEALYAAKREGRNRTVVDDRRAN